MLSAAAVGVTGVGSGMSTADDVTSCIGSVCFICVTVGGIDSGLGGGINGDVHGFGGGVGAVSAGSNKIGSDNIGGGCTGDGAIADY
ncbi:hypothetical protein NDU88_002697 [Pleurodeles waltl]|uniref:Uncharacterized protein n=1 Tax=Pleurodeles waltl TaxID=8319 RepID=A0AAV7TLF5_PLEWA|nr:hypothetical protein NDU88_002697 [Pleurodeles waltl]